MAEIQFTRITAHKPDTLTKSYSLADDGTLRKTPGGPLVDGTADRLTISALDGLAALIRGMGTDQALVYGVSDHSLNFPSISKCMKVRCQRWFGNVSHYQLMEKQPGPKPLTANQKIFFRNSNDARLA